MRARKFSFDIPKLKIGSLKPDSKSSRQQWDGDLDSPIEAPKSVRPPLSPLADAELRSACAAVLLNTKPSHIVFKEPKGSGSNVKQQLDYAAIKSTAQRHSRHTDDSVPLSKTYTLSQGSALEEDAGRSGSVGSEKYRYKPEVAPQDITNKDVETANRPARQAQLRADQLMSKEPPKTATTATRGRSDSHLRSASTPQQSSIPTPKPDPIERPHTAPRTASMETTGSTPHTDTTEYPWSEKRASTAMTSAAVTPARGSKRASSQALPSGSEGSSMPKVDTVDADWMRQELEKHKKAHEERLQQEKEKAKQGREAFSSSTSTMSSQMSTQTVTPATMQVPRRKPVPSRATSVRDAEKTRPASRQDSRISAEEVRTANSKSREVPDATERQGRDTERIGGRTHGRPPRAASRVRERAESVTRSVKQYVRSASTHRAARESETARPPSRAASVKRNVKEYFRPSTAASSRKPSVDLGRSVRGSRSTASFHSAQTDNDDDPTNSSNKWQSWRPFHRRGASRASEDGSRPGTSGSHADSRGRASTRDDASSSATPGRKAKPDLNRDLPPLPSLDSWKDSMPQAPTTLAKAPSPTKRSMEHSRLQQSNGSERPKLEIKPLLAGSGDHEDILAARMGSPSLPRSQKPSVDLRTAAPPQPTAPPPAPPVLSARMTGPEDWDYDQLTPKSSIDRADRRRSATVRAARPAPQYKPTTNATLRIPADPADFCGKTQVINYSRVAGKPTGLRRKLSWRSNASTATHAPVGHSRTNSDHQIRKLSMDEYGHRGYDNRYRNLVEISASPARTPPPIPASKEKKWWQKVASRRPDQDDPISYVPNGGIAGAPVIRY